MMIAAAMSDTAIIGLFTAGFALLTLMFNGTMTYLMARLNTKAKEAADATVEKALKDEALAKEKAARDAVVAANVEVAARRVAEVKQTLEANTVSTEKRLDEVAKIGVATHRLVNSGEGARLKFTMLMAKRVAELTVGQESHDKDAQIAEEAQQDFDDHMSQQKIIDENPDQKELTEAQKVQLTSNVKDRGSVV